MTRQEFKAAEAAEAEASVKRGIEESIAYNEEKRSGSHTS